MIDLESIHSLSDFKRNTSQFMDQLREKDTPLILTVNGRAELVVLGKESYQELLSKIEFAETVQDLKEGIASIERGEGRPAEQVLDEIAEKHDIPR